jgi:hypothetical protein
MWWSWLSVKKSPGREQPAVRRSGGHDAMSPANLQVWKEPVSQLRHAWPRIFAEFERARRYERSVTVAVFSSARGGSNGNGGASAHDGNGDNGNGNGHHGNGHGVHREDAAGRVEPGGAGPMAAVLAAATREIDLVTCHAGLCVVVMPEIGTEEGRKAVRRVRDLCADRLAARVEAGIAVFPQDGWVFLDLVEVARTRARDGQAPGAGIEDVGAALQADSDRAGRQQAAGSAR